LLLKDKLFDAIGQKFNNQLVSGRKSYIQWPNLTVPYSFQFNYLPREFLSDAHEKSVKHTDLVRIGHWE